MPVCRNTGIYICVVQPPGDIQHLSSPHLLTYSLILTRDTCIQSSSPGAAEEIKCLVLCVTSDLLIEVMSVDSMVNMQIGQCGE